MIENLILFYFTGTGNALAAANWISGIAQQQNISVEIVKITPSLKVSSNSFSEKTLIGFCYPTHGFNAPPVVVNFLLRFPKSANRAFVLNTRAGMKMWKLFTPGLSGLAQILPALVLRFKGFRMVGFQPMDLPSNWISVHPGLRSKVVNSIFERCKRKTEHFTKQILSGKKVFKGLISLPIDILIIPVSIAYYFFGRFALSKTFVADYNCNNCGICEKKCPVNAIRIIGDRPFWTSKCESCMHCMNNCPQKAIQTPHLFVLIIWWLIFAVIPMLVLKEFVGTQLFISKNYKLIFNAIILISGLPIVFLSYRMLHFLLKFRFFSWFVKYTSLTRFKFWRRYFAPKKYLDSSRKF